MRGSPNNKEENRVQQQASMEERPDTQAVQISIQVGCTLEPDGLEILSADSKAPHPLISNLPIVVCYIKLARTNFSNVGGISLTGEDICKNSR